MANLLTILQVFSAALIAGHWNIAPSRLGLQIREYPFEQNNNQKHIDEKTNRANNHNVASDNNSDSTNVDAGTSNVTGANYSNIPNTNNTEHAAHTHGYAPTHEGVTTEGGFHTTTARHDANVV